MDNERTSPAAAIITIVAVLLALGAIYYFAFFKASENAVITPTPTPTIATTLEPTETETPTPTVSTSPVFTLTEQGDSGQTGTVKLEEIGDQVRVTIDLSNPNSTPEPAHIHTGSCPKPGNVIFPLEDVVNGSSVTLLDTTLSALKAKGNIAVNVHKSAKDTNTYVSCGDVDL